MRNFGLTEEHGYAFALDREGPRRHDSVDASHPLDRVVDELALR